MPMDNPGFMVLRLTTPANQATGGDGSGSDGSPPQKEYRTRQFKKRSAHKKTKTGCTACKLKKIKCDEGLPKCLRCERAKTECVYLITGQQQRRQPQPSRSRQQQRQVEQQAQQQRQQQQQELQIQHLQQRSPQLMSRVIPLSQPTYRPDIPMFYGPTRATSGAQLVHHLVNNYSAISGDSIPRALLQFSQPHLLSAALTIAASHLEYHTTETQAHHLAQLYQLQYLCTNFNDALKQRWYPDLADSLITTSLSLHMLVFLTVDSEDPATSWVMRTDPARLNWLDFQLRLTPLVANMMQYRHVSMLPALFDATDSGQEMVLGQDGLQPALIPASWEGLLVPDPRDDFDAEHLFRGPLNAIAQTYRADGDPTNLFQFLQLASKVDHNFMTLLLRNDNRALWIFGYWFGLMGKLRTWWVRRRVTRDYFAILQYLTAQLNTNAYPDEPTRLMWEGLVCELAALQHSWWWSPTQHHHVPQPARAHVLTEDEVVREVLEVDELQ